MRVRYSIFLCLILLSLSVSGQNLKVLPDDPRIIKGKVANGFTYYLIENDIRHGYADFYLVRKVGSLHEGEGQTGFNTIIGEMGVEGTRNFPDGSMVTYLDELGLDVSSDFSSVYGSQRSYYSLENIPVGKGGGVIDSTLLILYNWAMSINLDEEEVESGKQYYKNGLALTLDGRRRAGIAHSASIFGGDSTLSDGAVHNVFPAIDSYKAKDLRGFYYKWFTPQRMAMVVVGDISPGELEGKIKTLFQALPKFVDEAADTTPALEAQTEPIVSVVSDKEVLNGALSISFTTDPLPANLQNTAVPFIQEYMNSMMKFLFTERMVYGAEVSEHNYHYLDIGYGPFMEGGVKEALKFDFVVPVSSVEKGLEEVMEIIYNVKNEGFTKDEFERARRHFFRDLNYLYDWRIFAPNKVYAHRAMDHFVSGSSLASIEMKKEYMDMVASLVEVGQFNTYVSSFLRGGDNCVVRYTCPEREAAGVVSRERLVTVVDSILASPVLNCGVDGNMYRDLIHRGTGAGVILSEHVEMITGAKVWNLSNGATVVFKKTQAEPNKFTFEAVSRGGLTLMDSGNPAREYINGIAPFVPVGANSAPQMYLHKKINNIELEREFGLNTTSLSGSSYTSHLDLFFQMVSSYFSPIEGGERYFEKYRDLKREELASRRDNPEAVFDDTLSTFIYHESRYVSSPDLANLENINYNSVVRYMDERFANAANFHFVVVGDVDEVKLREAVVKYIASLPGNPASKEDWRNVPLYLKKDNQKRVVEMKMEFPRSLYNMTLVTFSPFNLKSVVEMDISSRIMTGRVSREMKERGFPVKVESRWVRYPEEFMVHSITAVTKEYTEDVVCELEGILERLTIEGATSTEISNAKKVVLEGHKRDMQESLLFWRELLKDRFLYGGDMFTRYGEFVEAVTDEQINRALRGCLSESTNSILILKGVKDDTDNNSNR